MKQVWFAIPIAAGVIALLAAAAPDEKQPTSSGKPGLWVSERHSNMSMFLAGNFKTPQEAAARSAEMLKMPGKKTEHCITEALRKKTFEQTPVTGACAVPRPKFVNGKATIDSTCGSKTYRVEIITAPDHRVTNAHSAFTDSANPDKGGAVDTNYESREHITFTITLNRQVQGVHMIDVWDYRWVSPDCGALKPGESRPVPK
jgi:hypothetical protein